MRAAESTSLTEIALAGKFQGIMARKAMSIFINPVCLPLSPISIEYSLQMTCHRDFGPPGILVRRGFWSGACHKILGTP